MRVSCINLHVLCSCNCAYSITTDRLTSCEEAKDAVAAATNNHETESAIGALAVTAWRLGGAYDAAVAHAAQISRNRSEGQLKSPNGIHGLKKRILALGKDAEAAKASFAEWRTNIGVCLS